MSDAKFDAAFAKGDKDGSGGIGKKTEMHFSCEIYFQI